MSTIQEFSGHTPTWCPGCGDWGIGISIKQAFVDMGLDPSSLICVFDIGCSGNMNDFLNAYAMHSLHGRSIPSAVGIKLANHSMPVAVIGGDGGIYGEGGNHFIHACRGNHDINVLTHDNSVYGLTTGQVAPTALHGAKSKSTPSGMIDIMLNPLMLALTAGATFIAQSFAGDTRHLTEMLKQAFNHKGFSLVNVLQPCVTFNKVNTYQYYIDRIYKIDDQHNAGDFRQAMAKAIEMNEERYPLGIIYQTHRPTYHEQLDARLSESTLLDKERFTDFGSIIQSFV